MMTTNVMYIVTEVAGNSSILTAFSVLSCEVKQKE